MQGDVQSRQVMGLRETPARGCKTPAAYLEVLRSGGSIHHLTGAVEGAGCVEPAQGAGSGKAAVGCSASRGQCVWKSNSYDAWERRTLTVFA